MYFTAHDLCCYKTRKEEKMNYPLKTLEQLPLILRGFRQLRGYTQAAIAEKLGITQQSYAYFEANPATATVERLFVVLRILNVEISLDHAASVTRLSRAQAAIQPTNADKAARQKGSKTARAVTIKKEKSSADIKPGRVIPTTQKKESW